MMKWVGVFIFYHVYVHSTKTSPEDLEDFIEFINKTSRVEGNNNSFPREESNAPHVSNWEEGDNFEGDLILNDRQRGMIINAVSGGLSRNGLRNLAYRWPEAVVVYAIKAKQFSKEQMKEIRLAMREIANATECILFRPRKKNVDTAFLRIGGRKPYCHSEIGYQGRVQNMNIPNTANVGHGDFRRGVIIHQLLHALGFVHMHNIFKRDKYVRVNWENIKPGYSHNFKKYGEFALVDYDLPYDYKSILHYPRNAYSIDKVKLETLSPLWFGAEIGQRDRLSIIDIEKINNMYCRPFPRTNTTTESQESLIKKSFLSGSG